MSIRDLTIKNLLDGKDVPILGFCECCDEACDEGHGSEDGCLRAAQALVKENDDYHLFCIGCSDGSEIIARNPPKRGRPRPDSALPLVRRTVMLDRGTIAQAKEFGCGNLSRGLRQAAAMAKKLKF